MGGSFSRLRLAWLVSATRCASPLYTQEYRRGGEALAVKFYTTVPQRRRTADMIEERLIKDLDHEEKVGVVSPTAAARGSRRTRREPSSRAVPLTQSSVQQSTPLAQRSVASSSAPPVAHSLESDDAGSDYSDDSDYDSVGDGEYVTDSEDDEQLEVDLNAIMRQEPHKVVKPDDETPGYLPQLFTADERNRTDVYKPRRSVPWSIFYLAAGVAGPLALGFVLLLNYVRGTHT